MSEMSLSLDCAGDDSFAGAAQKRAEDTVRTDSRLQWHGLNAH